MYDNNNNNNDQYSYSYDPSGGTNGPVQQDVNNTAEPPKKKHGAAKAVKSVLLVLCMAAVSVGSIAGYKYIDENGIPFISQAKDKRPSFSESRKLPSKEENEEAEEKAEEAEKTNNLTDESLVNVQAKGDTLSTQAIYRKVLPSVVGVTSVFEQQSQTFDFWGFGSDTVTQEVPGTGTGIVMSKDGYILTNAHVICDDDLGVAKKITIRLADETEYDATIVGYDRQTDLAVLKADAKEEMTPAEFGSSESLKVGDPALAIGNPLGFDLFGTLTAGYISGLNREISVNDTTMKLIQTDAAINNGNSGGPLINQYGQVIGINSMKLSSSYSSSTATIEGLGFAIPIDDAKKIIDDLTAHGYVTGRPQLGITYKDLSKSGSAYQGRGASGTSGVQVVSVNENGPADKAGIRAGDVIVGADGELVSCAEDLKAALKDKNAGDTIKLTVVRNRNYYDVDVTLEDLKPDTSREKEGSRQ
ncbi:MAG: trypsin-like peptidase domain-containing protein [Oscillospiraceae bacterium]|nr:trypsin-like peptidase domain-containing protein [Oscillospiraceae bacterium]